MIRVCVCTRSFLSHQMSCSTAHILRRHYVPLCGMPTILKDRTPHVRSASNWIHQIHTHPPSSLPPASLLGGRRGQDKSKEATTLATISSKQRGSSSQHWGRFICENQFPSAQSGFHYLVVRFLSHKRTGPPVVGCAFVSVPNTAHRSHVSIPS